PSAWCRVINLDQSQLPHSSLLKHDDPQIPRLRHSALGAALPRHSHSAVGTRHPALGIGTRHSALGTSVVPRVVVFTENVAQSVHDFTDGGVGMHRFEDGWDQVGAAEGGLAHSLQGVTPAWSPPCPKLLQASYLLGL